jgi:hypothetical protein
VGLFAAFPSGRRHFATIEVAAKCLEYLIGKHHRAFINFRLRKFAANSKAEEAMWRFRYDDVLTAAIKATREL